ncbi:CRISPR-associated endonuclease cas1, subtype I-b/hmari/tneap [Firmicutes bacterium M10-2]|nr:CRISPR-associated endonuclease cas1, subtype I-b/hmari/tneap [Firmicutes bacterium M10-2]
MKPVYLYASGILKQKDYSICLLTEEEEQCIPIEQVEEIYCFGEVTFNKRLLKLLNTHKISVLFFDFYGNYIGRFAPNSPKQGKVLIEQVKAFENPARKQTIQNGIQNASASNMRAVLKYYQKKGRNLEKVIGKIDTLLQTEPSYSILLWEAQVKKAYYQGFDILLKGTEFQFEQRSKNPPRNEINAMMSYGYSVLYATILSIINRSRLVPEISFIHSVEKTGASLQYDLADIYKPVIIDRMIFKLVRKKQIRKDHFIFYEDGRCYFNKEGIGIFMNAYYEMLKSTIQYKGKSISYHSLLIREVNQLANYILKESNEYKPYIMKW